MVNHPIVLVFFRHPSAPLISTPVTYYALSMPHKEHVSAIGATASSLIHLAGC